MSETNKDIVIENEHGVQILESQKHYGHYFTHNAQCKCGEPLLVASPVFHPNHERGNPEMRCADHGVHAYHFKQLKQGKQDFYNEMG